MQLMVFMIVLVIIMTIEMNKTNGSDFNKAFFPFFHLAIQNIFLSVSDTLLKVGE